MCAQRPPFPRIDGLSLGPAAPRGHACTVCGEAAVGLACGTCWNGVTFLCRDRELLIRQVMLSIACEGIVTVAIFLFLHQDT